SILDQNRAASSPVTFPELVGGPKCTWRPSHVSKKVKHSVDIGEQLQSGRKSVLDHHSSRGSSVALPYLTTVGTAGNEEKIAIHASMFKEPQTGVTSEGAAARRNHHGAVGSPVARP